MSIIMTVGMTDDMPSGFDSIATVLHSQRYTCCAVAKFVLVQ